MSANSKIEWTHHTFNPWWGCTKVSPGCAHCYAERDSKRYGHAIWGDDAPRRFFGDKHWNEPLKWNAAAKAAGQRHRVFCASMADVFEDRDDLIPHRTRLFNLIEETKELDWLLVTKRPENIRPMQPFTTPDSKIYRYPIPRNVWLGISTEDQKTYNLRWPILRDFAHHYRPSVVFLSAEPLLGPIQLSEDFLLIDFAADDPRHVQRWVIAGGESGPKARPMHPHWPRDLFAQCAEAEIPFHFKQWGEWAPMGDVPPTHFICDAGHHDEMCGDRIAKHRDGDCCLASTIGINKVGKTTAGRLLDGREHNGFPLQLATGN